MSRPHPIPRRFRYDAWANLAALGPLERPATPPPDRAAAILAHIAATQYLWMRRIGLGLDPDTDLPVWPALAVAGTRGHLARLASAWPDPLGRLVAGRLDEAVSYTNSQGQAFTSTVGDILEHLLLHGAYHRGQVATLLGRAGLAPANTDFIHWVRSGEPGPA